MTHEQAQARLVAWMNGEIPDTERASLRMALASFPDLAAEWDLWEDLGQVKVEEPSPHLEKRLNAMLASFQEEEASATWRQAGKVQSQRGGWFQRIWPMQPALGMSLAMMCLCVGLVGGWYAGYQRAGGGDEALQAVRRELKDTRELAILAMLQQPAVGDRLQAVNYAEGLSTPDAMVLEALSRTLLYDTSVNVRLAAIGVLAPHRNEVPVRTAMQSALQQETSPLVQMELARNLSQVDHPEARQAVEVFLANPDLDPTVKDAVAKSLQVRL